MTEEFLYNNFSGFLIGILTASSCAYIINYIRDVRRQFKRGRGRKLFSYEKHEQLEAIKKILNKEVFHIPNGINNKERYYYDELQNKNS